MSGDERKRLIRIIVASWTVTLIALIVLVAWVSFEVRNLKNAITIQGQQVLSTNKLLQIQSETIKEIASKPIPTNGQDGQNGKDGRNGKDGTDGLAGRPPTGQEIAAAVVAYFQVNPAPSGPSGMDGAPGREIELGKSASTHETMWRYKGTTIWLPLEEAP